MKAFALALGHLFVWLLAAAICGLYTSLFTCRVVLSANSRDLLHSPDSLLLFEAVALGIFVLPLLLYALVVWLGKRTNCDIKSYRRIALTVLATLPFVFRYANLFFHEPGVVVLCLWTGVFLLLLFACDLSGWWCARRHWDTHGLLRGALMLLAILPLASLAQDAPAIPDDYSLAALPRPAKDARDSYSALMQLRNNGPVKVILTPAASKALEEIQFQPASLAACADVLMAAWRTNAPALALIAKLDTFAGIATVPDPLMNYLQLHSLAELIWAYALLQAEQGRPQDGAAELIRLYSVARKTLPYHVSLLGKFVWNAVASGTLETAWRLAGPAATPPETLRALQQGFAPLTVAELDLRPVIIGDYCVTRDTMAQSLLLHDLADDPETSIPPWLCACVRSCLPFFFNPNLTCRDLRSVSTDPMLAAVQAQPPAAANVECAINQYKAETRFKNLLGRDNVANEVLNNWHAVMPKINQLKVRSDLFALYLAKRTGTPLQLPDYYSGTPYRWDETAGLPFSTGPDRTPGTPDDIRLD